MKRVSALLFIAALQASTSAMAQSAPAGHGAPGGITPDMLAPMKTPKPAELPNRGKVVSFLGTPMYAYIEVDKGDKTEWLAAPAIELKVGDYIAYSEGVRMANFASKAVSRTFPSIMFVDYVSPIDAKLAAEAAPAAGHGADHGAPGSKAPAAAAAPAGLPHRGTVVSYLPSPMYSYIEVNTGDKTEWIAAQAIPLKVGDTISYSEGARMANFSSKAIGRTFPSIMFVDRVSPLSAK